MAVSAVSVRLGASPGSMEVLFMFFATVLGFVKGMLLPKKVKQIAHPMFVCMLVAFVSAALWGPLSGTGLTTLGVMANYSSQFGAGTLLSFMLGPAVTALGVLLYERRNLLSDNLVALVGTSFGTALVSLFGTAIFARVLALPKMLAVSSLLRCISSPFAADMVPIINASSTFAIAMVVTTGFIGVLLGPPVFNALKIKSARTRGIAMGAAAHGLGTVALAESDEEAFPFGAVGFVLVGTATSLLLQIAPLRSALLKIAAG
eukprot:TRINITY_DN95102_c0_g1_i1.p1 TRINITY_DN95102_c0_g1~~TRINITY_DN95102_c0_g1_i1.p1  ORF type:complete len:286 (-),score=47.38 TRINITY_DN95102_c0_g1_i1:91-873(-)